MNTAYLDTTIRELNTVSTYTNQVVTTALVEINAATTANAVNFVVTQILDELNDIFPQLAGISEKATNDVSAMQSAIAANLALLAPLMVAPTNLPSLITWAQAVINTYLGPQTKYLADAAELAAKLATIAGLIASETAAVTSGIANITSAVEARIAALGAN
jgi:hypothetical protein